MDIFILICLPRMTSFIKENGDAHSSDTQTTSEFDPAIADHGDIENVCCVGLEMSVVLKY